MKIIGRAALICAGLGLYALQSVPSAQAQDPSSVTAGTPRQAISANPFGLLLELFNAEYERAVGRSSTLGVGGSFIRDEEDDDYLNADVFWRFYPNADPLDGWAFGLKAGLTNVPDHGTFFGAGFDVNRSWLLGVEDNFYVGVGFGLKRLVGVKEEDFGLNVIPTVRIVNVGFAF